MRDRAEYDLSALTGFASQLNGALFANGQDGDIHRVLRHQGGLLAWEISNNLGPKTKDGRDAKVEKDMKQFLAYQPEYSNLDEDQQYSSTADFTWLQAGPSFLTGINDEDNQLGATAEDALGYLRTGQNLGGRGKTFIRLGKRGKQTIQRLNRTRISKSAWRGVYQSIREKVGTLRASFAYTTSKLLPNKRIPSWIARHFESGANGRAIFNDSGLNHPTSPWIEFGSSAPGVESNPVLVEAQRRAVVNRAYKVKATLQKVLAGYTYDWKNGGVFRRQEAQQEETE